MEGEYAVQVAGDSLRVGDSCFVHAEGDPLNKKPFIAKIMKLEPDRKNGGFEVLVQWYYRPEDPGIPGGRRAFHGERELYKSDHRDLIHSETILGRCCVHSLDVYRDLDLVRPHDYYSRFSWSTRTRTFGPPNVTVYCRCHMPENPDRPMAQCDGCSEWFHAECCGTTLDAIEALPAWFCPVCVQRAAQQQQQPEQPQPQQPPPPQQQQHAQPQRPQPQQHPLQQQQQPQQPVLPPQVQQLQQQQQHSLGTAWLPTSSGGVAAAPAAPAASVGTALSGGSNGGGWREPSPSLGLLHGLDVQPGSAAEQLLGALLNGSGMGAGQQPPLGGGGWQGAPNW